MIQIKISGIEGYFNMDDNVLLYSYNDNDTEDVQVSELTSMTVYQYNQLASSINEAYPNFSIKVLSKAYIGECEKGIIGE